MKFRLKREGVNSYTVLRDGVAIGTFMKATRYAHWGASLFGFEEKRYFPTRKEAYSWLRLFARNTKAAAHFMRVVKRVHPVPIAETLPTIKEYDDRGFLDKLLSFAESKRYKIIYEPSSKHIRGLNFNDLWGYCYDVGTGVTIYVRPTLMRSYMAHVLLHEMAHAYENRNGFNWRARPLQEREQLVDAVANAILYDYGFDFTDYSRNYLSFQQVDTIFRGRLDNEFIILYTDMSRDLAAYLKEA